jgi:hypothetical protein
VQHRAILYVDAVAYRDGVDIATQHGAEPYAAVVAYRGVAYDRGVIGKKAVVANLGCESPNRFDECHYIYVYVITKVLFFLANGKLWLDIFAFSFPLSYFCNGKRYKDEENLCYHDGSQR